jgi:hypothetical protein
MRIKITLFVFILAAIYHALGFFHVLPSDWPSIVNATQALEAWWDKHVPLPSLSALGLGLLLSVFLVPEIWRIARPYLFHEKFRRDINAAEGLKKTVSHSRRAKELVRKGMKLSPLMYESHLTEIGIIEARLRAELADEIHDHLRAGDITAWGTPDGKKPYQEIKPEEWSDIKIDFDDPDADRDPPFVHAVKRKHGPAGTVFGYVFVQFCSKQLYRVYPLSYFARRIPDGPREKPKLSQSPV